MVPVFVALITAEQWKFKDVPDFWKEKVKVALYAVGAGELAK